MIRRSAVARSWSGTLESSVRALEQQLREHEQELTEARDAARVAREQLAEARSSATLRLRDVVLKLPIVGPVTHAGARRLAQMLRSS